MLSYEDQKKIFDEVNKKFEEEEDKREQERLKELEKRGIVPPDSSTYPKKYCDHPNTMENGTATFFWIVAMIISILFKGGWVLCILETITWWKFITRHNK